MKYVLHRRFHFVRGFPLILTLTCPLTPPSIAKVREDGICQSVKLVQVVLQSAYKCVESSKKFVWRKVKMKQVLPPRVEVIPTHLILMIGRLTI